MTKKKQDKELENMQIRRDIEQQIEAAEKARSEKLQQSKEHLIAQLKMAEEKYLTVNGYMQARSTYDQVLFNREVDFAEAIELSCKLAHTISDIAGGLASGLEAIDVMELDGSFLDGLLITDFINGIVGDELITEQLLVVNLLQNVGPAIDDIVSFREGTAAELDALRAELDKYPESKEKPALKVIN